MGKGRKILPKGIALRKKTFLIYLFYLFLSLLTLYYLIPFFSSKTILPENTDTHLSISILFHNLKHLSSLDLSGIYDFPIYYPYSQTLSYGIHLFGQSVLVLPLYLSGLQNFYFLHNFLLLLSLFLSGISLYHLARELLGNETAAVVAGALFLLLPGRQVNFSHLNVLFFFPSVLALLFLLRTIKKPVFKNLFLLFFFVFLQGLFSLSFLVLIAVLFPPLTFFLMVLYRKFSLRIFLLLIAGSIITAMLIFFIFRPYFIHMDKAGYSQRPSFNPIPSFFLYHSTSILPGLGKLRKLGGRPLFPGFVGAFFLFYFFYTRSKNLREKISSYILLASLSIPALILLLIPLKKPQIRSYFDFFFLLTFVLIMSTTSLLWRAFKREEKFLLFAFLFLMYAGFYSIYRLIPLDLNYFQLLRHWIPGLARLRGHKYVYFFAVFLNLLIAGGVRYFNIGRKKKVLPILLLILVLENFPLPLTPGPLKNFFPYKIKLYQKILNYPDYYGVLELPHFNGSPSNNFYTFYTIFHNKHIYNGLLGTRSPDPFRIYYRIFSSPEKISTDLTDKRVMKELKEKNVLIITAHREFFGAVKKRKGKLKRKERKRLEEAKRNWWKTVKAFLTAKEKGFFEKLFVSRHMIIGVLSQEREGKSIKFQIPSFSLRDKNNISLTIKSPSSVRILVELNGKTIKRTKLQPGESTVKIPIKLKWLKREGNYFTVRSSVDLKLAKIGLN